MNTREPKILPNGHIEMPRLDEGNAVESLKRRLGALDASGTEPMNPADRRDYESQREWEETPWAIWARERGIR